MQNMLIWYLFTGFVMEMLLLWVQNTVYGFLTTEYQIQECFAIVERNSQHHILCKCVVQCTRQSADWACCVTESSYRARICRPYAKRASTITAGRFLWLKGCAWSSSMMQPLHIIAVW